VRSLADHRRRRRELFLSRDDFVDLPASIDDEKVCLPFKIRR
jgi:hypothetical protein